METLSLDEDSNTQSISIYPNLAKDELLISEETSGSFHSVSIIDMLGKVLIKLKSNQKRIDTSVLSSGTYFVIFRNNSKTPLIKKLIIE